MPSLFAGQRRSLAPFALLSATYFAHIGFFNPYLPLWLKEMGYGLFAISLLTAVQAGTRLFAPYVWGWWSDRTGERVRLMRWCACVALVCSMALGPAAASQGLPWLALVLLVMFTHTSALVPLSETAMAHLVSENGRFDAHRYGRMRLFGSLGFLLTVLLAGWWFERSGMSSFTVWTVLSLVAIAVSVGCMPDLREQSPVNEAAPSVFPVLCQPQVVLLLAAAFFHVLSHAGLYVFFSLYLDELGYSKTTIGALWAVSVLVEIIWFFCQTRWLHWLSLSAWVMVCSALTVVRMGATAWWADSLWLLVLMQCLHAFTFATHHTANVALISHYFPSRLRGRGQAIYTVVAYGLTGVLGSLLGGLLSERWGLASVFLVNVMTAIVATVLAACLWRRLQRP
jgi:MFS transporter, PPP family, 3-phenylpropionic acid transporter